MTTPTMTEPSEISIDSRGQLAKHVLDAVERAEADRTTYITRDGVRVAAIVPLYVGRNFDVDVPHDPVLTGKIVPKPLPPGQVQLELHTGEPAGEPAS